MNEACIWHYTFLGEVDGGGGGRSKQCRNVDIILEGAVT